VAAMAVSHGAIVFCRIAVGYALLST